MEVKLLITTFVLELSFCGIILENENTLSSYGVTPGVTIHVLEKPKSKKTTEVKRMTEIEVQQLVSAFRTFTLSSGYRAALQVYHFDSTLSKYNNF